MLGQQNEGIRGRQSNSPLRVRIALFVPFLIAAGYSLYFVRPPAPKPAFAPQDEFSAERAVMHLSAIARAPRPTGSQANKEARDYIVHELEKSGLTPEIQAASVARSKRGRPIPEGMVHNIVATLPGINRGGGAIFLVSHYDSVPSAPGASDDGAAVAAMLETLRGLRQGPPLLNDIVFLFTDAEELGLIGADAFVENHPLVERARVVLNFEARGSRGPVYMFEASDDNGWLIENLADSAPFVVASSLSAAVYRRMPNDTDFTVFLRRGISGMNFAYIGGLRHYHTENDTVENLDRGSLQHHGEYMLALSRKLGNADLAQTHAPDRIYFSLPGGLFIHYPSRWALPFASAAGVIFASAILYGIRRGRLRFSNVLMGLVSLFVGASLAVFGVIGTSRAIQALDWRYTPTYGHRAYDDGVYMVSFTVIALAGAAFSRAFFSRRASFGEIWAGSLLAFLAGAVITSIVVPAASYLFLWPAVMGVAGFWKLVVSDRGTLSFYDALVLSIFGGFAAIMVVPTIQGFWMALTLLGSTIIAGLIALFSALFAPSLDALFGRRTLLGPALALAFGLLIAVVWCTYVRR